MLILFSVWLCYLGLFCLDDRDHVIGGFPNKINKMLLRVRAANTRWQHLTSELEQQNLGVEFVSLNFREKGKRTKLSSLFFDQVGQPWSNLPGYVLFLFVIISRKIVPLPIVTSYNVLESCLSESSF